MQCATSAHCTCFLLKCFCEELNDDVIEIPAPYVSVAHCGEHLHILLDEVHDGHAVALGEIYNVI